MAFEVTVQRLRPGVTSLRCTGALDLAHASRFDDAVRHAEREAASCLVLDLRGLDLLDSAGVSRLLAARGRAQRNGRRLVLVRARADVEQILHVGAVAAHFDVVADPHDVGG